MSLAGTLLERLETHATIIVVGPSGSGKTAGLLAVREHLGARAQYIDIARVATTPEQFLHAVVSTSNFVLPGGDLPQAPTSPRDAYDAVLNFFAAARTREGQSVVFLLDEALDLRTFEAFPGLRGALPELLAASAPSRNRFVLASGFEQRVSKLLREHGRDLPVVPADGWTREEVTRAVDARQRTIAQMGMPVGEIARTVHALTAGRPAYVSLMLDALAAPSQSGGSDPVAALTGLLGPNGRLSDACRYCYEFRLHRARGYGALKAILNILSAEQPLTLTHIARRLGRTPGSTRDYLLWLEDVDLIGCERKRYAMRDALLRTWVRLNGRPVPPTDDDVAREAYRYAAERLADARRGDDIVPPPTPIAAQPAAVHVPRQSGIIEID